MSKNPVCRAAEKAPAVECLPPRHEDWNSDAQIWIHIQSRPRGVYAGLLWKARDGWIPEAHW